MERLETKRLVLEPVTPAHADETWPGLDDAAMWRFFPELRPRTLEHLRTIYERREHGSSDDAEIWLNFVCRERENGRIVGEVQATILRDAGTSYVAYAVFSAHQRRGFAREALTALIEHVRRTYGIRRFLAEMDTQNRASYTLAESLGFKLRETKDAVERANGAVSAEYVYELLVD